MNRKPPKKTQLAQRTVNDHNRIFRKKKSSKIEHFNLNESMIKFLYFAIIHGSECCPPNWNIFILSQSQIYTYYQCSWMRNSSVFCSAPYLWRQLAINVIGFHFIGYRTTCFSLPSSFLLFFFFSLFSFHFTKFIYIVKVSAIKIVWSVKRKR